MQNPLGLITTSLYNAANETIAEIDALSKELKAIAAKGYPQAVGQC